MGHFSDLYQQRQLNVQQLDCMWLVCPSRTPSRGSRTALRPSVLAALFGLLSTTIVAAQECRGFAPFQGPMHLFVRGLFNDQTTTYGGGVGLGGSTAFGDLNVEGVSIDALGASSFTVGGDAGLEVPLDKKHIAQLCPLAEWAFALGPNDVGGAGVHYRETDYSLGVTAGIAVNGTAHAVSIIPTGSYAHINAHNRFTDASGAFLNSHDRSSDLVTFGVGLVFSREVSITPSVSRASWAGGGSTTFGLRLTLVLGGGRVSMLNSHPTSCAGLSSGDSAVYDTSQVTERPRLRGVPELTYPLMERDLAIGGRVIVDVIIAADGAPALNSVRIVQTVDPALDRAALRWISGVSYWPACRDGRPVRARIAQPVDFCPAGCSQGKF